ncbi:hypothetical protein M5D96_001183 [Drosophila gunungcola]|uniref:Uncharacterized protein n=1 Tax=Drosophila gunungcola TaxID=103775 RepID=A0A9Q0BUT7_9MUSC|nr:hypothetical protein M5D96_001183 [Drosophila gunungcola]
MSRDEARSGPSGQAIFDRRLKPHNRFTRARTDRFHFVDSPTLHYHHYHHDHHDHHQLHTTAAAAAAA